MAEKWGESAMMEVRKISGRKKIQELCGEPTGIDLYDPAS